MGPATRGSPDVDPERLLELIRDVYRRRNPAKLMDLSALLRKWKGREVEMYEQICAKYGEEPQDLVETSHQEEPAPARSKASLAKVAAKSLPAEEDEDTEAFSLPAHPDLRPKEKAKPKPKKLRPGENWVERKTGLGAPVTPGAPVRAAHLDDPSGGDEGTAPAPPKAPPPLRSLIEAYFSDAHLQTDRFLHELISGTPDGWVDVDTVLQLRKVKEARARSQDVVKALKSSPLEVFFDPEDGTAAVRRPKNRPLPELKELAAPADGVADEEEAEVVVAGARAGAGSEDSAGSAQGMFPGRLTGKVSTYDEESGSASISCPQTEMIFQRDVTVDWREIEQSCVALQIGSRVSFLLKLGERGEPMARSLQLRSVDEDDDDEVRRPVKYVRKSKSSVSAKAAATDEASESELVGKRHVGTIKSFHDGVGFGFISCRKTQAVFGRDIALDKDQFAGFAVGDTVSFELAIDEEMGTPKAMELEAEYASAN